jgi:hypothetical protein
VTRALIASALLLALGGAACVDDNIPARPSVDPIDAAGGAGQGGNGAAGGGGQGGDDAAGTDGGDDSSACVDGGASDGGSSDGGPVQLASASPCRGIDLVVSEGTLFWTEEATGKVMSIPTAGGCPTVIASDQNNPGAIAVDDMFIFWVAEDKKVIKRRAREGGTENVFVPMSAPSDTFPATGNNINALLVANKTLFYGRFTDVFRIPTDGSELPQVIAINTMFGVPQAFVLDSKYLYQVEGYTTAVTRERIDGTQVGLTESGIKVPFAPDPIAVGQTDLLTDTIGFLDDHVVWAAGSAILRDMHSTMDNFPTFVVKTTLGGSSVTGFVITNYDVYFGEGGANTVQVSAAYDNPTPRIVATDQMSPSQFAADAQNVYWRTADCRIMKLAKH